MLRTYRAGVAEHSGGNDLLRSHTPYLNVVIGLKDLAMRWREQLKSETCSLKKVVCFKYVRTVSAKAIKLQYQVEDSRELQKLKKKERKLKRETKRTKRK